MVSDVLRDPLAAYRLRWKRRRLLWRAFRARHDLHAVADRTRAIHRDDVLLFVCLRNEAERLPHFLAHYRALGVGHFLAVDNGSTDGGGEMLAGAPDVSLWSTGQSYRGARFGTDWLNRLLTRHGRGHWCVSVDADEILVYRQHDTRPLPDLCAALDRSGRRAMGALMLDVIPKGPLGSQDFAPGGDPFGVLTHVEPGPWRIDRQAPMGNLVVRGGTRDRAFFATAPDRAPTLNKLPLVRWRLGDVYVNSTHSMLPPGRNLEWDGPDDPRLCGVLLHTKFLPSIRARSIEEQTRRQHFGDSAAFDAYRAALIAGPDLGHPGAVRLSGGSRQLAELGLTGSETWPGEMAERAR